MKILLITKNATIEKLFKLSASKRGDEVAVGDLESIPDGEYEVVFIDKELFSDELFNSLKSSFNNAKFILILNKNDAKIPGFDEFIIKPFLPTDVIELLDNINKAEDIEEFDLEEDFVVSDEDLQTEAIEDDEEEDFIIDESELDEDFEENETKEEDFEIEEIDELDLIQEDVIEERALEDEVEIKEEVDEDFVVEELDETPKEEISNEVEEDFIVDELETEESADGLEEDILEESLEDEIEQKVDEDIVDDSFENEESGISSEDIENISENELDELDKELENIDEKALAQAIGEEVEEIENKENSEEKTIQEKTLGNILNINWEELKKAKAKVTITIDFGG